MFKTIAAGLVAMGVGLAVRALGDGGLTIALLAALTAAVVYIGGLLLLGLDDRDRELLRAVRSRRAAEAE